MNRKITCQPLTSEGSKDVHEKCRMDEEPVSGNVQATGLERKFNPN